MPTSSDPTEQSATPSADNRIFSEALHDLAGIIDGQGGAPIRHDDPVVVAASKIAEVMGFALTIPPHPLEGAGRQRLRGLAQLSGFRLRNVLLTGKWWNKDNGPLILFSDTQHEEPLCLIPTSPSRYQVFDPAHGELGPFQESTVEGFSPQAVMLYRPLPNKTVRFFDLCRMIVFETRRDAKTLLLMGVIGGLIGMVTPVATGLIFDEIIPEAARSQLWQLILILLALGMAKSIFDLTQSFASIRMQGKVDHALQAALWDRLLALPAPFFRQFTAGELASKSFGINTIIQTISGVTINTVLSTVFSTFNLFLLFYYDVQMALLALGLTLITILFTVSINYLNLRQQRQAIEVENKQAGFLFQLIGGMAKIRMTGTWKRAFERWSVLFTSKKRLEFKIGCRGNMMAVFNAVYPLLSSMAIFSWMVLQVKGEITTGQFLAFNAAFGAFQGGLLNLAQALTASLAVLPLYEGIKPILETLPEVDESQILPGTLRGAIEVCQVRFRYDEDGPNVLDKVSIQAKPGEFIAIVGSSGSGKSTLLRLLLGFETPNTGSIFYDDKDLETLNVQEVRRQLGVVLQNGMLVQGTVMENIIGQSNLSLEDAWEAARMAGLEQEIKEMPMGMHTVLPAGGGVLSGGQRQRLMIARALVKKPTILYFDEATSALDNKTQMEISCGIETLNVTRVVIAHRLSTIENADRIYVLDKGKVVEEGSCQELLQKKGLFAELAKRQTA